MFRDVVEPFQFPEVSASPFSSSLRHSTSVDRRHASNSGNDRLARQREVQRHTSRSDNINPTLPGRPTSATVNDKKPQIVVIDAQKQPIVDPYNIRTMLRDIEQRMKDRKKQRSPLSTAGAKCYSSSSYAGEDDDGDAGTSSHKDRSPRSNTRHVNTPRYNAVIDDCEDPLAAERGEEGDMDHLIQRLGDI
jgi:hypothetical protein